MSRDLNRLKEQEKKSMNHGRGAYFRAEQCARAMLNDKTQKEARAKLRAYTKINSIIEKYKDKGVNFIYLQLKKQCTKECIEYFEGKALLEHIKCECVGSNPQAMPVR